MNGASLWVFCLRAKNAVLSLSVLAAWLCHSQSANAELSTADPLGFFTNLSSRLLQSELGLSLNRIQIYPTNQYTPAVHRLLQVTANTLDATTNRFNTNYPYLPSVFRPLFTNDNDHIYICGYEEENGPGYATNAWRDLNDPSARAALQARDYVYGIPVVIGAKKGFPHFNEFAVDTVLQITRRLQITRPSLNAPKSTWQTNQMSILGISNILGVELWNSYRSNYPRAVDIFAKVSSSAILTNNFGLVLTQQSLSIGTFLTAPNGWSGYGNSAIPNPTSFLVPIRTNWIMLPDSVYLHAYQLFSTNLAQPFESGLGFPIPQWGISLRIRLNVFLVDHDSQRLVDLVTLEGLKSTIDLSGAIRDPDNTIGFDGLWSTNLLQGLTIPQGVVNQMNVAIGNYGVDSSTWMNYGVVPANLAFAVDYFRALYGLAPFQYSGLVNTNLIQPCPFTPTRRISVSRSWQANDPLIHPQQTELQSPDDVVRPLLTSPVQTIRNIGFLNNRYSPWGGNPMPVEDDPNHYNASIKDALIWRSDYWSFPDSEPLSLVMLGRVHRGTPWQTIYLKSAKADAATWLDWLHTEDSQSAERMHPTRDWHIAALIASLISTNSPHALLSANERDTNAWLAKLDGLTVLTNTSINPSPSKLPTFDSLVISSNSTQAVAVVNGIAAVRSGQVGGVFRGVGELLASPTLSVSSPWLNQISDAQVRYGISDEAYERLPSLLLPLLRADSSGSVVQIDGDWQLEFTGFDNYPYAVELSSNLVNWYSVSTNYPTNGVFSILLTPSGQQFFRSRLLP